MVSQVVRLLSIRTAQIFAAAAASLSGPATSLSCMPSPLLPSFTTMSGCKAVSAAFDLDLSRPRQSARKPATEFAVPTSTANSVRWTVDVIGAASALASSADGAAATTSGAAAAAGASGGASGAVNFAAAASGGAIIDLAGISGVAGVAVGVFDTICRADGAPVAEPGSDAAATGGGLSGTAVAFAAAAVATGATAGAAVGVPGGSAFAGDAGADKALEADEAGGGLVETTVGEDAGAEEAVEGDIGEEGAGEEGAIEEGAIEAGWGAACGEAAAAFCRAIEPVTESRPCSRTVTREYSRSRSPLRVSMAEASRRVSFWLSLATDWICCDLPRQIAAGNLFAPPSDRRLVGQHRDDDGTDRAHAPGSEPPERAPVELIFLGQKAGQQPAGIFGLEAACQMVGILRHTTFRPSRGPPNHATNINRKYAGYLESERLRGSNRVSTAAQNTL